MSKKFDIKPPIWPKELTFEEFKRFNPLINEGQLIPLYNQYLNKLISEFELLKENSLSNISDSFTTGVGGAGGFRYNTTGIGGFAIGTYLDVNLKHFNFPQNGGYPRFTVGVIIDNNAIETSHTMK